MELQQPQFAASSAEDFCSCLESSRVRTSAEEERGPAIYALPFAAVTLVYSDYILATYRWEQSSRLLAHAAREPSTGGEVRGR